VLKHFIKGWFYGIVANPRGTYGTVEEASAEYNTSSKVGIPMLRSQMNGIINIGHGHQSYTVDPMSSKCYIATRNTLWIYVRELE
jgi:hypothetical protein